MDVMVSTGHEAFTVNDLDSLPGLPGAKHELYDGVYVISSKARALTVEDLGLLVDVPGAKRELLDGVIEMVPAPSPRHQGIVLFLSHLLREAAAPDAFRVRTAPTDVYLSSELVIQPDVLVVRPDQIRTRGVEGAPLLAVEVLSRTTRSNDLEYKRGKLEAANCACYWIIDPGEPPTLTVLELVDGAYVEVARVSGSESWTATRPFPVTVVPDELVDD